MLVQYQLLDGREGRPLEPVVALIKQLISMDYSFIIHYCVFIIGFLSAGGQNAGYPHQNWPQCLIGRSISINRLFEPTY